MSQNKKLFVRNLPYSCSSEQLREAFESVGPVEEANVVMDRMSGRSRGFGFVTYKNPEDAKKAIETMNGYEIDGRNLEVDMAKDSARESRPRR